MSKPAAAGAPGANDIKEVCMRVVGGSADATATLGPKLGPLGLSAKKVGTDIATATKKYTGLKVTVKLIVQNRNARVEVVPTASTLVIESLNEPVRDRKKEKAGKGGKKDAGADEPARVYYHNGNTTLDKILGIARTLRAKSMAKDFKGTVKEVLGTADSVGCTVENKKPRDIIKAINDGTIDIPDK
eukprot:TRINITY_DN38757_c0_g1_i1.p2 TRINITY_DN38757_c0_g1~~TRINITY_DN38757_c0_g1_i1.p2  ORF type:complete len:187 (+),score=72.18 TRINITY_DN38757_c0_g1_i1:63-623(+)